MHAHAVGAGGRGRKQLARRLAGIAVFRRIDRARGRRPRRRRPGLASSSFSSPSSTCQNALLRGSPGSKKCALTARMQRHVGGVEPDDAVVALVDMAVPAHRRGEDQVAVLHLAARPLTMVAAPSAGWRSGWPRRCGDAGGPVARIEHGEGAEQGAGGRRFRAPKAGCDMISARRSMSSIETSATARCRNCSMSRQGQWNGVSVRPAA